MQTKKINPPRMPETILLVLLVLAICGLYAALLRPGVTWADDWATYIQDALNILQGKSYSATGYIINPDLDIGPTAYPPLFPLTLVLPISIWGVDYHAIREFQLIFWGSFLIFFNIVARRRLAAAPALLLVAAVGLAPYFFVAKDTILSECLFLPLLYVTFIIAARFEERFVDGNLPIRCGVWLGLMAALCIATRSVGLILLPVFAAYDLVRFRRLRAATLVAIAIASVAFFAQMIFVDFFKDYMAAFYVNSHTSGVSSGTAPKFGALVAVHLAGYTSELSRLWGEGANGTWLARITSIVFVVSAICGFLMAVRRKMMHSDVFALLYSAALLVLPSAMAGARMELPFYPLFYMYIAVAVTASSRRWIRWAGAMPVIALGGILYLHYYRNLDSRAPLDGIETTDYADMFTYIKDHTSPDSTIVFDKPRTLALYTGRHSVADYDTRKGDALLAYMHFLRARYILLYDPWYAPVTRAQYRSDLLGAHVNEFVPDHDSGHFVLYRIRDSSVPLR